MFGERCLEHYARSELAINCERLLSVVARSHRALTSMPRLCMQDWFLETHRSDIQPADWSQKLHELSKRYMQRHGRWYSHALRAVHQEQRAESLG